PSLDARPSAPILYIVSRMRGGAARRQVRPRILGQFHPTQPDRLPRRRRWRNNPSPSLAIECHPSQRLPRLDKQSRSHARFPRFYTDSRPRPRFLPDLTSKITAGPERPIRRPSALRICGHLIWFQALLDVRSRPQGFGRNRWRVGRTWLAYSSGRLIWF